MCFNSQSKKSYFPRGLGKFWKFAKVCLVLEVFMIFMLCFKTFFSQNISEPLEESETSLDDIGCLTENGGTIIRSFEYIIV